MICKHQIKLTIIWSHRENFKLILIVDFLMKLNLMINKFRKVQYIKKSFLIKK
jgi:hypothetical protein